MSNKISTVISILALVVAVTVGFITVKPSTNVGSITPGTLYAENYAPYLQSNGGFYTQLPISTNSDLSVNGGSAIITTADTATSTVQVGCIQTTATSTQTPIRFVISVGATSSPTFSATNSNGFVFWQFGTCPNL